MTASLSFYANVFGFIVGGVSLLWFAIAVLWRQLPSNKIKVLENLLDETENTFRKAIEGGRLEHEFVQVTERQLTVLKDDTHDLQSRAYDATSFCKDCAGLLTSIAIWNTCRSLEKLRAEVISLDLEGRRGLTEIILVSNVNATSSPSVLPFHPEPLRPPNTLPFDVIPRPCSCPPAFPVWKFNVAGRRTNGNPFRDPTKGGSDVRTIDVRYKTSIIHTSVTLERGV